MFGQYFETKVFMSYTSVYFIGITTNGFFFLAIVTTVFHCDGTNTEVSFLAPSMQACMESHSICEWPDSKNLWLITCKLSGELLMLYNRDAETNLFLFWPMHASEKYVISLVFLLR